MDNTTNTEVHISQIKVGDTIFHNGHMRTVCGRFLKEGGFCGTSVFGDSYNSGYKPVTLVTFNKPVDI